MPPRSKKQARHDAIRRILDTDAGSTQEDLREQLAWSGIATSQSSLSRDLRELGALKVPVGSGGYVYRLPDRQTAAPMGAALDQAVREFCVGIDPVGHFLVVRTTPGNARDLCLVIDRQEWREVVGTLAGDDTILMIARTPADIERVRRYFDV